jgi:hypothetical protein
MHSPDHDLTLALLGLGSPSYIYNGETAIRAIPHTAPASVVSASHPWEINSNLGSAGRLCYLPAVLRR